MEFQGSSPLLTLKSKTEKSKISAENDDRNGGRFSNVWIASDFQT
jgi:hypothetical protein